MNRRITITREQVDKLLEMCKDSFPEYPHVTFETKRDTNEIWFSNKPEPSPDPREFHWFELCVTELPRVIFEKLDRFARQDVEFEHIELVSAYQSGGEMLYNAVSEGLHVIDLLYKEYKKLKKWESINLIKQK
jgi:hypothetical protein